MGSVPSRRWVGAEVGFIPSRGVSPEVGPGGWSCKRGMFREGFGGSGVYELGLWEI